MKRIKIIVKTKEVAKIFKKKQHVETKIKVIIDPS